MKKLSFLVLLPFAAACVYQPLSDAGLMELPAVEEGDIILEHSGYISSYDAASRIPEWVAYELTADETSGDAERGDRMFMMDPSYKKTQAMREDYSDSGWTKGHMAPAADFRWDSDAMGETFYLTNVCPQSEDLNAGDWEYLERRVRYWAKEYGKAWVVCGPIIGQNRYGTIGQHNVVVPDAFFKAVLVHTGFAYSAIGFIMGNDSDRYYLKDCAVSIDELENITGLDLFPTLDDSFEEDVESAYNPAVWFD